MPKIPRRVSPGHMQRVFVVVGRSYVEAPQHRANRRKTEAAAHLQQPAPRACFTRHRGGQHPRRRPQVGPVRQTFVHHVVGFADQMVGVFRLYERERASSNIHRFRGQ